MNFIRKISLGICISAAICMACSENNSGKADNAKKDSLTLEENIHAEKLKNLKFYFGEPTNIENSDYVIYPINTQDNNSYYNNGEVYSSSKKENIEVRQWNLLFHNSKDSSYHLLTESEKWLIESFYVNEEIPSDNNYERTVGKHLGENTKKYIFYNIRKDGVDEEKDVSFSDPSYLYVSDRNGKNLRQISPDYYNLTDWHILKQSNILIMRVQPDSNKDKRFDYQDEEVLMQVDLNNLAAKPQRILSPAFEKKIKEMFLKRIQ